MPDRVVEAYAHLPSKGRSWTGLDWESCILYRPKSPLSLVVRWLAAERDMQTLNSEQVSRHRFLKDSTVMCLWLQWLSAGRRNACLVEGSVSLWLTT